MAGARARPRAAMDRATRARAAARPRPWPGLELAPSSRWPASRHRTERATGCGIPGRGAPRVAVLQLARAAMAGALLRRVTGSRSRGHGRSGRLGAASRTSAVEDAGGEPRTRRTVGSPDKHLRRRHGGAEHGAGARLPLENTRQRSTGSSTSTSRCRTAGHSQAGLPPGRDRQLGARTGRRQPRADGCGQELTLGRGGMTALLTEVTEMATSKTQNLFDGSEEI